MKEFCAYVGDGWVKWSTSTILIPAVDQDPTVHLTQSFWMAVAPPILVANQIWSHLAQPWEPSINIVLFLFWLHIIWRIMMTRHSLLSYFSIFEDAPVLTLFFCAPAVEVVLELRKYYFWRNFWGMTFDVWFTYAYLFIFRIYHKEEQK